MQKEDRIIFQLATHYLPKIALRLECLFLTIEQSIEEKHPVIHHYALNNIMELIKLVEKPELKSRFLKEFMRIEHIINKPDKKISNKLYTDLFLQIHNLSRVPGRFGEDLHKNQFLQSIRLSQSSQFNDFELHSPQLLLWLESDSYTRCQDLINWLEHLTTLRNIVDIYLALLRHTAEFDAIDMSSGFFQQQIPSRANCHLILLRMDKNSGIVPKMQLGYHGLSLRLCESDSMREINSSNAKIDLAICQI